MAEELSSKLMSGFLKTNCDTLRVVVRETGTQREIRYSKIFLSFNTLWVIDSVMVMRPKGNFSKPRA